MWVLNTVVQYCQLHNFGVHAGQGEIMLFSITPGGNYLQ